MFWGLGRFGAWDVLEFGHSGVGTFWALGTFCSWDVLGLGRFIGVILRSGTFCIWDVCRLGRFVLGCFVGAPVCSSSKGQLIDGWSTS